MIQDEKPSILLRKKPKQARANALIEAILEAAIQVLAQEGAARFTTARVAERAGVSIGSLYQYFPNKAAILFHLQSDEWRRTTDMWRETLEDTSKPPLERLRILVHAFIKSECDEAELRGALDDAAPLYRDVPEAQAAMEEGEIIFQRFMLEALPSVSRDTRKIAGSLIAETMTEVGKSFSESPRKAEEILAYANAMSDMFCAYIQHAEREN